MTRVILTNKQTGQELPEAELRGTGEQTYRVQFDGCKWPNGLNREEWYYREVRTFRNGDVLRRKDRMVDSGVYVHLDGEWYRPGHVGDIYVTDLLSDPEWEVV